MTEKAKPASAASDESVATSVRVVGQYIKDLSFENPNVGKLLEGQIESPQMQIEVNVNAKQAGPSIYECMLEFTANATSKAGPLYTLELEYGSMLKIENMPPQTLEPFLLINAPALMFPFVRRLIADVTREGGFPPLMLDPIDFASLYVQRKQAAQNGAAAV